jgi:hypothetical protein
LPLPSSVWISSSAPCSQTPLGYVPHTLNVIEVLPTWLCSCWVTRQWELHLKL